MLLTLNLFYQIYDILNYMYSTVLKFIFATVINLRTSISESSLLMNSICTMTLLVTLLRRKKQFVTVKFVVGVFCGNLKSSDFFLHCQENN